MSKDYHSSVTSWFVMHHLNPQQIEILLQKDSEGQFLPGSASLPPYRFYVPFLYMPATPSDGPSSSSDVQKPYDPLDDKNALRNDMRCFVFIQASEDRVLDIVQSDWNRQGRLHLQFYRDTNHQTVRISDEEMRALIVTFQDSHLQFSIDQPLDDFTEGDRVILQMEPWTGKRGQITGIRIREGHVTMTIGVNILGRTKSIKFRDLRVGDVLFEDSTKGRLLSDSPITNFEEEIIDLLSHQVGGKPTDDLEQNDRQRLHRLSTYDKVYVEDPEEQARFLSLSLVCAHLSHHKKKRDALQQRAMEQLHGQSVPTTDAEAYLMTALFIVTRHAHYRTAVKDYHKSHPDTLPVLRRYLSIIKHIKARRPTSPAV